MIHYTNLIDNETYFIASRWNYSYFCTVNKRKLVVYHIYSFFKGLFIS